MDFVEGNTEEISVLPFIDEEFSHFTVLAETVTSGGPRHVKVWAVQHKPKSAMISFKTRRKIYEFTMPYFLRYQEVSPVKGLKMGVGIYWCNTWCYMLT